jgi:hypothetical protein
MPTPNDPLRFAYEPDPADVVSYGVDLTALLDGAGVAPGTLVLTVDAGSIALGVSVAGGALAPALTADGSTVVFWIAVDPASRDSSAFDRFGVEVVVVVDFSTTHVPPRTFERSTLIAMRNR